MGLFDNKARRDPYLSGGNYGSMDVKSRSAITESLLGVATISYGSGVLDYTPAYKSAVHDLSKKYIVYTDGGYFNNKGACAFTVLDENGNFLQDHVTAYKNTTNNRMEIRAILTVLEGIKPPSHLLIVSDSQYCVNTVNNWIFKWARGHWTKNDLKNVDLWKRVWKRMHWHNVRMAWVKGHSGVIYNEHCDQLAEQAIKTTRFDSAIDCRNA